MTLYAFGALVALAVVLGSRLFQRRAERLGLNGEVARRIVTWMLIPGFFGAHLVERLFYSLDQTLADPWSLLRVWEGLSSYGGFLGAVIGLLLFFGRHRAHRAQAWRYLDALAVVFPVAWIFGRLGCFVAYDHPGRPTNSFLGQMYADGVVRHNLGLEEALYSVGLAIAMAALARRPRAPGALVGWLAILYAPGRFLLDLLRIGEDRVGGLVVSQYGSIALLVAGLVLLLVSQRRLSEEPGSLSHPVTGPGDHPVPGGTGR